MTFLFEGEGEFPISRIAQSKAIWANNVTITSAKLTADVATQDTDIIIFELGTSATETGSYTFEEVTNTVSHFFGTTGKWIKWRARLVGYANNNTYFENMKVYINQ